MSFNIIGSSNLPQDIVETSSLGKRGESEELPGQVALNDVSKEIQNKKRKVIPLDKQEIEKLNNHFSYLKSEQLSLESTSELNHKLNQQSMEKLMDKRKRTKRSRIYTPEDRKALNNLIKATTDSNPLNVHDLNPTLD